MDGSDPSQYSVSVGMEPIRNRGILFGHPKTPTTPPIKEVVRIQRSTALDRMKAAAAAAAAEAAMKRQQRSIAHGTGLESPSKAVAEPCSALAET